MDEKKPFTVNDFILKPMQDVILAVAFNIGAILFHILSIVNGNVSLLSKSTDEELFRRTAADVFKTLHVIIIITLELQIP